MKYIKIVNKLILASLFIFTTATKVNADVIVTDQLEGAGINLISGGPLINTVDIYSFSTTTTGAVSFDVFGFGFNGTFLDSMIWLFKDDGVLGSDDMLGQNDDEFLTLNFGDGSFSFIDSYLTWSVAPGNYLFAIGWCCDFAGADIVDGVQGGTPDDLVNSTLTESYNYKLTITGDIDNFALLGAEPVSEPTVLALFGLALLGLASRRKQWLLRN